MSALHLLEVMVDTGKPLSELAAIMEVLPQALVNAKVPNHKKSILWSIRRLQMQSRNWRKSLTVRTRADPAVRYRAVGARYD